MSSPCLLRTSNAGVALLIRHAERPDIPAGSFGHDLRITEAGRRSAFNLGRELGAKLGRVVASPVPRCMQTGAAILEGAGVSGGVHQDRRLGDPGAWIADEVLAGQSFLDGGSLAVVGRQLLGSVPGVYSLQAGTRTLLGCFFERPSDPGRVDVFISHDAVMAPLLGHLLHSQDFGQIWPEFLEGACFVQDEDAVRLLWRHHDVPIDAGASGGS